MTIEITHVRFNDTRATEAEIIRYKWRDLSTNAVGDNDKPSLVAWVDVPSNSAVVGSGRNQVQVGVVNPPSGQPYLRTHADGVWNNNLVNLPQF
ncbi:DUF3892 domain-containing protein [Mycetocola saprophilus]|uniref:DUF3892 domain-containing protein n=1 Tax=Mycetocola saprophilus TaxID=76636 RepID=UPI003BF3D904